jgi:tRNA-dihydrouridine synthase B
MIPLILAPLRGFTDAVFRNAFQRHFQGVDEAVAPFVTSIKGRRIKASHLLDLKPLDNRLMPVVPQILSNHEDEFIRLANTLFDLGYPEINWNLGCPYPMVAKKMRGSGLLPYPDVIDRMLEKILGRFEGRLSIKTRLGRFCADEMDRIIPVFNRYPLARIIVHPRTGVQMYAGTVDLDAFESCLVKISHPVVYNGDIHNLDGYRAMEARFEGVSGWMVGRGFLANPFLAETIRQGHPTGQTCNARFAAFHDDLVDGYLQRFSGPGHVLDRMKGFWRYFSGGFADGRKVLNRIRKSRSLDRFRDVVTTALAGEERWFDGPLVHESDCTAPRNTLY